LTKIIYATAYPDQVASDLLAEAGVRLVPFETLEGVRA
jgi:hypothetical protein